MTELAPELSEPDAHEAASRLRRTSTLAELALDDLAAGMAPSWWGQASEAYYASRGQVSGRLTALDSAATTLANAIDTYANDAGRAAARWRQAESDLDHARAHPSAAALTDPSMAGVDAAEAEAEMARAEREYRLAVAALSQAAQRTCQALDDVRDVEDHVQEAIDTFGQLMWVDSATAAISLGFGWTSDRDAWWDQVTGIVPGIVDQAAHPIQTAREVSGQQHFANGDWGKGIGTAAGAFSLRHMLRDADHADSATSADPPDGDVSEPDGDDSHESPNPNDATKCPRCSLRRPTSSSRVSTCSGRRSTTGPTPCQRTSVGRQRTCWLATTTPAPWPNSRAGHHRPCHLPRCAERQRQPSHRLYEPTRTLGRAGNRAARPARPADDLGESIGTSVSRRRGRQRSGEGRLDR